MALFARAEIAVVPSVWAEPFGRAAIEAMGQGCALIATAVGGLPEVVGDAGELVAAGDVPALAATMVRLARDADLRARLQAKARERAASEFDIARVAQTLDALRVRYLGAN
jgi:glycosyltransferase involved in cell wall biosynthesis